MKLYFGILLCSFFTLRAADDTVQARIRAAAAKAVAVIQNSQKTWFSKQSCYSCHQQVLPALGPVRRRWTVFLAMSSPSGHR